MPDALSEEELTARLATVTGELDRLFAAPRRTYDDARRAGVLDAEQARLQREVARRAGLEYPDPIPWPGAKWVGTGEPRSALLYWRRAVVVYQIGAKGTADSWEAITFSHVRAMRTAAWSTELLMIHPWFGRGLRPFEAYLVRDSEWLANAQKAARESDPRGDGYSDDRLQHWMLCFWDDVYEVLARDMTVGGTGQDPERLLLRPSGDEQERNP